MRELIFDLQRFATQTISAGETYELDGVTYTAITDTVLNLDDNNKVSGIASGKVQAVVTGAENSPKVTFDATDSALTFTATSDGKVISMTPFPIEFISGEFTYKGGRLDITAGSDLAIVSQSGDFSLRNENHFVTDSSYIFTSTSLTSDSEHVDSLFSLTNGTDVRRFQLEQRGKVINHFDQRGVTLVEGSSEVLNLGDYKLTATATDGDAGLNFDLDEKGMTFVPNTGDGKLTVALTRSGKTIFGGVLECTSGSITVGYDKAVTFAKDTSFNFTTPNNSVLTVTANGEATTAIALTDNGITFTPGSGDGGLNLSLSKKGKQVFEGSLNITDGTITFDTNTKQFSFSDGTKIALGIFGLELNIEVVGNTTVGGGSGANFGITADENGNLIFTPDENGGSFNISLKKISTTPLQNVLEAVTYDDEAFFENNVTVTGSIMFNPEKNLLTLKDGTKISLAFDNYTLNVTADGDAASTLSLTKEGVALTPQEGDGTLNLTIGNANGSMSANLEILSGSFILGENGALTVTKDTELQITFSDEYSVKFKTTDDAGGSISLGDGGITFTPNEGDGHLELSVTRDGETRNASLEMTGSLTYKLDGSISLAKDTVLKNVFEDGNILTITANTDADGSILFHPQNGLIITPATPDALNIRLKTDDLEVVNISSITGTLNYSSGVITASDGSQAHLLFYNDAYEIELRTNGGSASFTFTDDRTVYTANEGATAVLEYPDGATFEIQNGSFSDIYATDPEDAIELISEGSTFKSDDDEFAFTLGKAGNYTLNGMKVTTTADNAEVMLADYDTIIVDGISYTALDDNVALTIDGDTTTCAGGKVSVIMEGTEIPLEVDTTNGSLTYDSATKKFSFAEGTSLSMQMGDNALQFVAKDDFSISVNQADDKVTFKLDGSAEFDITNGDRKATIDFTGGIVYESGGKMSLTDGTEINLTWEDGNKLKLNSHGSNGSILLDPDKGVRITSDDEKLDMTLTTAEGYSSTINSIKGSLWYKAGTVTLDANTFITGKNVVEGHAIGIKFEAIDGTGKLNFANTRFTYSAGTGKNKVTYTLGDQVSSFTVNKGSVFIQNRVFNVAEGSDVATNFKDFIPAQYFKTGEAGTYTINGQTITTTAEGLELIATDDYMSFKTSDDVVEYNGMTFAGNGNVSLSSDKVVLGAGVEATGFGEDKTFVLAEAGNVTADARVFQLDIIEGVPTEISVTGAQDGFIFSRELTKESEAYLDEVLNTDAFEEYTSPYIGKIFAEKFVADGDSSYRIRTDSIGLEEVIGISNGTTIKGNAILDDEKTLSYYDIITETEGDFTIGEQTYNISGDSSVAIQARFTSDGKYYASAFKDLDGTVSGDFTAGEFKINGSSSSLQVYGDTDVSIAADDSGYEILGLDAGASLQVSEAGIYKVNGTAIAADASDVIVGMEDEKTQYYALTAGLADYMLHKTAAGYPAMAKKAFHPDEENPAAPKNYHSVEEWTTTSNDNLQLSAIHYSPKNPTGKWVILVHGYGKNGDAMNGFAKSYLAQGMDVLIVDQRAAGKSDGNWLTMGVAEAEDLAIWTQEIAKTNANAQITLHGVSMGAATVMLCAALPDTENVSAMIEDCGYGNIADVFAALMYAYGSEFGLSGVDYYELFDDVAKVAKTFDGGYDVTDAAPFDSITDVTVPSLFIHGADDGVIPSTVASELYETSGATNKTILIIEGAGHAQSIELDRNAYFTAVKNLIDSSTTEIGALIDSDAKNKLLRGTIYNDTIENSGQNVTIEALGGDDLILNEEANTVKAGKAGSGVSIVAGEGDDTIHNHHSYYPTIQGGKGDDSIVVSSGHYTYVDGGKGNDSIIGLIIDDGWAIGGHATVLGGADDDYISTGYTNDSTLDGGKGDDTIITCGLNNTINGGAGKNLINLDVVDREDLSEGSFIVLNGQTTVEGFKTGFGEGTDTVYIKGASPAVDFKAEGLSLYYNNDETNSLTFADISSTDKLNIYYKAKNKTVAEVFIADDEWYSVTEDDLSVMNDRELLFVGATAKMNHGIDFSGITGDVNATLLGHNYPDYVENLWINNIHSIKGGAGLTTITGSDKSDTIIAGTGAITINAAQGDDFIRLNSSAALVEYTADDGNDTIYGFNANSTLSISGGEYYTKKRGKDLIVTVGDDSITLIDAATLKGADIIGTNGFSTEKIIERFAPNKVSLVKATDSGRFDITLTGGDLAVVEETSAQVSISASKDSDTVFSQGENVTVKLNGGATNIYPLDGSITLENYDASTKSGFGTSYDDILTAINDGEIYFNKGKLSIDSAVVDFNGLTGGVVNFFDLAGNLQKVGFASDNAELNASNETANLILVGGSGSTLRSGDGNDTVFARDGALIDAGAGENLIELPAVAQRSKHEDGSTIKLTSDGLNIIENFNAGFDDTSDRLFFGVNDTVDFKFDGTDLEAYNNGELRGIVSNVAANAPFVNILAADDNAPVKIAVAQKDSVITVDDELADLYIGEKSGVDFTGYKGEVMVNLGSTEGSIGCGEVLFSGINQITVGGGLSTLIGSANKETLTAGTGDNSIWSGAGNDEMVGKGGSSDKKGSTTFFFRSGDGNDIISDFEFLTQENSNGNTADKIAVDSVSDITKVFCANDDVVLKLNDSTDYLTIKDAVGKVFQINDLKAKVDRNISYDGLANCYVAETGSSLTVDSNVGSAEIWLDNSHGTLFLGSPIRTLDASAVKGNTSLVGNEYSNTIIAGQGDSSLWGGSSSSNDLLVGGESKNTFYYMLGNGKDTITSVNDGDSVILSGVNLSNIISTDFTNNAVALNFSDGGKLTVNENGKDLGFVVGDKTFYVNNEHNGFVTKK